MSKLDDTKVTFRLPVELLTKLDEHLEPNGTSRSWFLRKLLESYLASADKK